MMTRALRISVTLACLLSFASGASAATITFEVPASINPIGPGADPYGYFEADFAVLPTNTRSAVFDSTDRVDFPGDTTDFFGFAERNLITLVRSDNFGAPFSLGTLLLGPITIAADPDITTITLVGFKNGGSLDRMTSATG
jgi:hypothetical protein